MGKRRRGARVRKNHAAGGGSGVHDAERDRLQREHDRLLEQSKPFGAGGIKAELRRILDSGPSLAGRGGGAAPPPLLGPLAGAAGGDDLRRQVHAGWDQVTRDQTELAQSLRLQGAGAGAFWPLLLSLVAGLVVGVGAGFDAGFAVGCTATLLSGIALVRRGRGAGRAPGGRKLALRPAVVFYSVGKGVFFGAPVAALFSVVLGRAVGCRVGLVVGLITVVMKMFAQTGLKSISDMVGGGVIFGLAMLLIFGWTFGPAVGFNVMLCAAAALGVSTAIEHHGLDDRISGGIFYGGGFALCALLVVGTLAGLDAGVKCAVGSLLGIVLFFRLHYGPSGEPETQRVIRVQVPAGVQPGQHFKVNVIGGGGGVDGTVVTVRCPDDACAGQYITCDLD